MHGRERPRLGSTCILGHAASIRREVLELADGGRYRVAMPSASADVADASPFAGPEWKEMDSREPVDTSAHDAPAHHMVGAGGFEPPTSSVSRKARETPPTSDFAGQGTYGLSHEYRRVPSALFPSAP